MVYEVQLAVISAGFAGWVIFGRVEKRLWVSRLPLLAIIAGTAVICWIPV